MEILSDPTPDMLAMPRFDDGAIDMQELLRRLAEQVVNAVMDAEADQLCGGGANSRNGYRERSLATCVGTQTLRIPELRSGSFFPEDVLERHRRVDRALVAAVAEMYATGTSTRKVQRVAEKMGVSRLSKDQVSAIASSLDADIEDQCARPLGGSPMPYVWLDATYVKCRRGGRVASTAVVTAIGCDAGGWRRVLGVDVVDTESYDSWLAFLWAIRSRGAAGVRLVVSDAHPGLVRALGEVFQGAAWQRCAVHLMRDSANTEPDALAYLDFPPTHWKRLRTNNVQERTNREIKRRSRVVQVFPSTGSLVRLADAVMCEQDEIWQESRYFSEARMNELYDDGRTRGIDGHVDWARLEAEARKMLESGLELADRVEAA